MMAVASDKLADNMRSTPSEGMFSVLRDAGRVVVRSRNALIGLIIIIMLLLTALFAPWVAPHDPTALVLADRTKPPSIENPMGTDRSGRDILSRLMYGARISLLLGFSAVALAFIVGTQFGLVSGYFGGWLDTVFMRIVDVLLAFPLYLIALFIIAILGASLPNTAFAIAIATAPTFARLTRGETLALREREFIEASRAIGTPTWRILVRHILPNILGPLMVLGSLGVGTAILVESSLSFLGLGPPPPTPTWGRMINDGLEVMRTAFWVALFPGVAITLSVMGFNLLGDGLRDALDPRQRTGR